MEPALLIIRNAKMKQIQINVKITFLQILNINVPMIVKQKLARM